MPRKPSCECGECKKCVARVKAREAYQALSLEERRAFVARRDPATTRANDRARYERDKAKRRAAADEYAKTPEGQAARARAREAWERRHPEEARESRRRYRMSDAGRASQRAWQERNPEKRAAHAAVWSALRSGALVKGPCVRLGDDCSGRIEAHHEDYSRPLEVVWACVRHHDELDKERA